MAERLLFAAGMSRSGGTVQYQLLVELMRRYGWRGIGLHKTIDPRRKLIAKREWCHDWMREMVLSGEAKAVTIHRDPRDVAVSMMRWRSHRTKWNPGKPGGSFEDILDGLPHILAEYDRWEPLACHIAVYEEVWDQWDREVLALAKALEVPCAEARAVQIADKWSVERNRRRQDEQMFWFDVRTGLTKKHIGEEGGQPGLWQERLTPEQVARLDELVGEWRERHGYE